MQEDRLTGPVKDRTRQHTEKNRRLLALLGKQDRDEQAKEYCDNGQNHCGVCLTHTVFTIFQHTGRHGAEEVTHDIERGLDFGVVGVDANIGAEANNRCS